MSNPKRIAPWWFIASFAAVAVLFFYFAAKPFSKEDDYQWMGGVTKQWTGTGTQGGSKVTLTFWLENCPRGLILPKKFTKEEIASFDLQAGQKAEFQIAKRDVPVLNTPSQAVDAAIHAASFRANGKSLTQWSDLHDKEVQERMWMVVAGLIFAGGTITMVVKRLRAGEEELRRRPASPESAKKALMLGSLACVAAGFLIWESFQPIAVEKDFRKVSGNLSRWEATAEKNSKEYDLKLWLNDIQTPFRLRRKFVEQEIAGLDLQTGNPVEVLAVEKHLKSPASGLFGKNPRIETASVSINGKELISWSQYLELAKEERKNVLYIGYLFGGIGLFNVALGLIIPRR